MTHTKLTLPLLVIGLAVAGAGCATKKYVRQTVSPVQQKVDELDKKTTEHAGSIEELEKDVSRVEERAMTADSRATAAGQEASKAQEQARTAGSQATEARSVAERGLARTGEVERTLGTKIENMDNYKLVTTESVLFGFDRAELNDDAKRQLDEIAENLASAKHYVVEIQGFTDKTGPREYNLELSRKRAAAVVRYLTLEHRVPLHRIHIMGFGSEAPVADNTTREGRKQNRRVEVRFFRAEMGQELVSSTQPVSQ